MRIDKIEIKNFRSFEKESFNLNPRFTVFIGDNAKGKTTILDALAVAIGSYFRGIDVAKQEIKTIKKSDIRLKTFNNDPKPQLPSSITAIGSIFGRDKLKWFRKIEKFTPKLTTVGANNIQSIAEEELFKSRSGEDVVFPVVSYFRTGRLFVKDLKDKIEYEKKLEGVASGYFESLSSKSSGINFLSWYKTYEDEVRKFGIESDWILLEAFNSAIVSMIPDNQWVKMSYSFKEDDLIGLFLNEENKYDKLLFSQLSDGFRNIIGIVADIAIRCIKLNPYLGKNAILMTPGIVLIDEIDLHLHPNWQRRIVEDFKKTFPKIQFVVTTHSPFIVQSLSSDELINLDRKTDIPLQNLNIDEVATEVMGLESEFSSKSDEIYKKTKSVLKFLKSDAPRDDKLELINQVSDPGLRALLELNLLSEE